MPYFSAYFTLKRDEKSSLIYGSYNMLSWQLGSN